MMWLQFLRQLYSIETLDTRFVVPATAPPKEALEEAQRDPAGPLPVRNGQTKSRSTVDDVQPPRWNTPEYYVYFVVVGLCVPFMCKTVVDVSKGKVVLCS